MNVNFLVHKMTVLILSTSLLLSRRRRAQIFFSQISLIAALESFQAPKVTNGGFFHFRFDSTVQSISCKSLFQIRRQDE